MFFSFKNYVFEKTGANVCDSITNLEAGKCIFVLLLAESLYVAITTY